MKSIQLKSYFLISALIMMMALILVGCADAAAGPAPTSTVAPPVKLIIAGSGGTADLLKYLSEPYRQEHRNWSFDFLVGVDSGDAVEGALDGTLDLGAVNRPLKDEELAQEIKYIHLGDNRIVFVTSKDTGITRLTTQQIKDIFSGKITNWSEVGGSDTPIDVLVRGEDEPNTKILRKGLFGDMPLAPGAASFDDGQDLDTALARSPRAIAYSSLAGFDLEETGANIVMIDDMDPKDLTNDYPYTKPALAVYSPSNEAKLQPFLDFVASEEAKALLAEQNISAPTSN